MSKDANKSDDTILSNAQSGNKGYIESVIKDNRTLVERIALRYKNSPLEYDDLIQEGMIGLLAAVKSYDSSKGASFKTYAGICIENSIQSALRQFNRKKDIPDKNVIRLYDYDKEIPLDSAEDTFMAQESVSLLTKVLREKLSNFENEVLKLHIVGCSYNEIARRLSKTPKAIDNALQRVRKKLSGITF